MAKQLGAEQTGSVLPDEAEDEKLAAIAAERLAGCDPAQTIPAAEVYAAAGIRQEDVEESEMELD